jgi:hypothetical protein
MAIGRSAIPPWLAATRTRLWALRLRSLVVKHCVEVNSDTHQHAGTLTGCLSAT